MSDIKSLCDKLREFSTPNTSDKVESKSKLSWADESECAENTSDITKEEKVNSKTSSMCSYVYLLKLIRNKSIKIHFENLSENKSNLELGRVIFNRFGKKTTTGKLYYQSNGLVVDASNDWQILVMPVLNAIYENKFTFVNNIMTNAKGCSDAHVYPLINGTMINYYYHKDKWCLSSSNGYEVNDLIPEVDADNNGTSYQELFEHVSHKNGYTLDGLDKAYSYSFIMSTKSLNKLIHGKDCIYLCQAFNIKDQTLVSNEVLTKLASDLNMTMYDTLELKDLDASTVVNNNKSARADYVRKVVDKNGVEDADTKIDTRFGYFIKYTYKGNPCNAIVQSSLFTFVKNIFFDFPPWFRKTSSFHLKDDKDLFIMLRIAQNKRKHDSFTKLFPEYMPALCTVEFKLALLVEEIVILVRSNTYDELCELTSRANPSSFTRTATVEALAGCMVKDLKRFTKVPDTNYKKKSPVGNRGLRTLIQDSILFNQYTKRIYKHLLSS